MRKLVAGISLAMIVFCQPLHAQSGTSHARSQYQLGVGDRLKITVFGEDKLSGEFAVNGDGTISFPLIGYFAVRGKSLNDVTTGLTAALANGFLRSPQVSAEVISFRPIYILGEVARPGEYPFAAGMTIYSAVAKAGGFTYRANRKKVYIRHENEPGERAYGLESNTEVSPGDTIRITERFF